jgi:hypothetical protein
MYDPNIDRAHAIYTSLAKFFGHLASFPLGQISRQNDPQGHGPLYIFPGVNRPPDLSMLGTSLSAIQWSFVANSDPNPKVLCKEFDQCLGCDVSMGDQPITKIKDWFSKMFTFSRQPVGATLTDGERETIIRYVTFGWPVWLVHKYFIKILLPMRAATAGQNGFVALPGRQVATPFMVNQAKGREMTLCGEFEAIFPDVANRYTEPIYSIYGENCSAMLDEFFSKCGDALDSDTVGILRIIILVKRLSYERAHAILVTSIPPARQRAAPPPAPVPPQSFQSAASDASRKESDVLAEALHDPICKIFNLPDLDEPIVFAESVEDVSQDVTAKLGELFTAIKITVISDDKRGEMAQAITDQIMTGVVTGEDLRDFLVDFMASHSASVSPAGQPVPLPQVVSLFTRLAQPLAPDDPSAVIIQNNLHFGLEQDAVIGELNPILEKHLAPEIIAAIADRICSKGYTFYDTQKDVLSAFVMRAFELEEPTHIISIDPDPAPENHQSESATRSKLQKLADDLGISMPPDAYTEIFKTITEEGMPGKDLCDRLLEFIPPHPASLPPVGQPGDPAQAVSLFEHLAQLFGSNNPSDIISTSNSVFGWTPVMFADRLRRVLGPHLDPEPIAAIVEKISTANYTLNDVWRDVLPVFILKNFEMEDRYCMIVPDSDAPNAQSEAGAKLKKLFAALGLNIPDAQTNKIVQAATNEFWAVEDLCKHLIESGFLQPQQSIVPALPQAAVAVPMPAQSKPSSAVVPVISPPQVMAVAAPQPAQPVDVAVLLAAKGYQRMRTRGDGNCLFSAFAISLSRMVKRPQLPPMLEIGDVRFEEALDLLGEISRTGTTTRADTIVNLIIRTGCPLSVGVADGALALSPAVQQELGFSQEVLQLLQERRGPIATPRGQDYMILRLFEDLQFVGQYFVRLAIANSPDVPPDVIESTKVLFEDYNRGLVAVTDDLNGLKRLTGQNYTWAGLPHLALIARCFRISIRGYNRPANVLFSFNPEGCLAEILEDEENVPCVWSNGDAQEKGNHWDLCVKLNEVMPEILKPEPCFV